MGRRRRGFRSDDILQGVLLVDKPSGMTSHDVCQKVRYTLRVGKVGHGGTLDPFATGLLPLMINGATRLMPYMQTQDKIYEAVVRLGVSTDTLDVEGEVLATVDASHLEEARIRDVVASFLGKQTQTIPKYSAARVDGKHLYEYARAGEEVELPTKEVEFFAVDISGIERGETTIDVTMTVHCSVGTYVRALAQDIGDKLEVGGHLHSLRRTAAGNLSMQGAITLDAILDQGKEWRDARTAQAEAGEPVRFEAERNANTWRPFLGDALRPVEELLGGVPVLPVTEPMVTAVQGGSPLRKRDVESLPGSDEVRFVPGDRLVLRHPDGMRSVALVRATVARDAFGRLPADAIVLQVERVLR
ncbi:MAG: tRNA pseudouridine(55) synthase TruB [Deltaproteobacteria bacterium]|nr:tRNA pseudouridine(55) synthase TruB [Deltaproteobacteria bacterium]